MFIPVVIGFFFTSSHWSGLNTFPGVFAASDLTPPLKKKIDREIFKI